MNNSSSGIAIADVPRSTADFRRWLPLALVDADVTARRRRCRRSRALRSLPNCNLRTTAPSLAMTDCLQLPSHEMRVHPAASRGAATATALLALAAVCLLAGGVGAAPAANCSAVVRPGRLLVMPAQCPPPLVVALMRPHDKDHPASVQVYEENTGCTAGGVAANTYSFTATSADCCHYCGTNSSGTPHSNLDCIAW